MSQLCFVIPCMGRLSFLKQTLGPVCAQPNCSCVVVDYSCPEHAGDWVEAHFPQVRVVRCPGRTVFSASAARNAGGRVVDAPWVCFLDADLLVEPNFSAALLPMLRPGCCYRPDAEGEGEMWTLVCARTDFERVGGYDEVFQNWGDEDIDLYDALAFAGVRQERFPAALLRHLPHPDEARTRHYAVQNLGLSLAVNRVYRLMKWDLARLTGSPLALDLRQQLYQGVLQRVQAVFQTGKDEIFDVQFGYFAIPGKWRLDRQLTYKVKVDRGS